MSRISPFERAFIAVVVLTIVIGALAYRSIVFQRSVLAVANEARLNIRALESSMLDAETGVRGFTSTHDRTFLEPYSVSLATYPTMLATLRRELKDAGFSDLFAALRAYDTARLRWNGEVLRPLAEGRTSGAQSALQLRGKADVDAMRLQLSALDLALSVRIKATSAHVQDSIALSIFAIVLCTVTLGGFALVSERRRAGAERILRSEIDRRNLELERSNEMLQQFAYVASHDLQEPLRTVASFAQLLERRYRGKLDASADEYIGFIVDGATRMQRLINDVLQYSRVTTQGRALERVSLDRALETARANLYSILSEGVVVVEAEPLPAVAGDQAQLAQLLQNLIGNAIKYNRSETPAVRISARRHGDDGMWQIDVRDNGIGIDAKYHERVFGLFQRLHGRTEYSGTGIGLALCKRIVERHGGRIWVESVEGQGTTFSFTLRAAEDAS